LVSFLVVSTFFLPFASQALSGSRLFQISDRFLNDPFSLLLLDASVNDRFFHVFYSLKGFLENFLLPHGFGAWIPYVSTQFSSYPDYVLVDTFTLAGRIMSGYGSLLFELGLPGLLIPFLVFRSNFRIFGPSPCRKFGLPLLCSLLMFSSIPLSFPLFSFYLGFLNFLLLPKRNLTSSEFTSAT
jgi:hypothetical protein